MYDEITSFRAELREHLGQLVDAVGGKLIEPNSPFPFREHYPFKKAGFPELKSGYISYLMCLYINKLNRRIIKSLN